MRFATLVSVALMVAIPAVLGVPLQNDGRFDGLEARGVILNPGNGFLNPTSVQISVQTPSPPPPPVTVFVTTTITTPGPAPTTTRIDPVGPLLLNHPHRPRSFPRDSVESDMMKRFGGALFQGLRWPGGKDLFTSSATLSPTPSATTSTPAPTTTRIDPVGPLLLNHPHNLKRFILDSFQDSYLNKRGIGHAKRRIPIPVNTFATTTGMSSIPPLPTLRIPRISPAELERLHLTGIIPVPVVKGPTPPAEGTNTNSAPA
ncbi:hypothetical protein QCA50_005186 [Cerrena zonata]|uniref:Uncharacterized protein n=1 Tax=Cerrena zonata TaxID=2478898 RepID=A0AAW0GE62_9APHY